MLIGNERIISIFYSQAQQDQLDTFNQLGEKLLHVADQKNREKIQRQNTDINLKWTNTINSIDNQIETLSQIAQNWSDLERDSCVIEKGLSNIKNKIKEIEIGEKSQPLLEEIKNNILVSCHIDISHYNHTAAFNFTLLLQSISDDEDDVSVNV